ncbi:MAG: hypothetical protein GEU78_11960 [Actinobacteria bacterium]|nr:hypothetical protein [Actinomycetota bacterium]
MLESRKLSHNPLPHPLVAEIQNFLQLEPSACRTTIGQAHGLSFSPYLEAWMGALRGDPQDAFEKRTSIREVALLMPLIESKLQFTLAHAMSSSYAPTPRLIGKA